MSIKAPSEGKATINEYPHKLEIIIPNKKSAALLLTSFGMVLGGIAALVFSISTVGHDAFLGGETFIFFWRILVFVMIVLGLRSVLFSLLGKEVWTFEGEYFSRLKQTLGYKQEETYYLNLMKGLRLSEDDDYTRSYGLFNQRHIDVYNLKKGTIKFDYGRDTVRVGNGLSEAEAHYIIDLLKAKKILTAENFY